MRDEQFMDVYCLGKFKYESKPAAMKVASLSSGRRSRPMSAYKCPNCKGWHIGQPIKRRRL